ncbi:2-dehydro-3-deoxyphosphogluconate aldolase / (4S)-4-hydroxy-2-oxoglutarate aldolase [Streptomyces sp. DvalAA-14]|uniref:bifunctional 4-hydroxy-2-oxoglutarate aldolase/2-dehydro-3-deoxy-phosphogluconate aldolase n=1 Tax=unclassified Streptomyces TaxID=2593676 RepID=UPI00081B8575|nr:2-dehydro-3-deoxyphosphogluconate aldolase [Streptomyces sp. DvalAA-14]MYS19256.1 2-dehydro-3-deoxyphosphogluconate aldolase [Streptomyces sp. SID4948]SCD40388.1 2-dehydro-3-deoxyphosphogluconate aldolase / (4S)-4-hydroxy-2-oxoglutarate aldolase [Streptomyces sp. DvalAA-14]
MYRWEITRAALDQRVFATIRSESYDQAAATADTLLSAGLTTLEISLTTPFALEAVTTLVREVGDDAVIGAGTVLDEVSARMAIEAGARFLLSPNLDEQVLRTGHRYGIPVFPGVSTPTEAVHAMELGADALTLYPATAYTPDWVIDVRAIIPQAALLPIGGITVADAPHWVAAGAVAVGMGSSLTDGDRETVTKRLTELLERLADVR